MSDLDGFNLALRLLFASEFYTTRKQLHLTQVQMAERLHIDPRSYAELEHGRSLCCTRVFILYLFNCKAEEEWGVTFSAIEELIRKSEVNRS